MSIHNSLDVTIFIPCHNESASIINAFEIIHRAFAVLQLEYEIVVMDDCSTDNTYQVVDHYIKNDPLGFRVRLYKQKRNMGLAYNFADAAFLGRGKYFRQANGSADDSEANLINLFGKIGKADIIVPYHETAQARSIYRRIISKTYTMIINLLTGHRLRYYNGCAIYLREDIMRWHSHSHGYGYQAELVSNLLFTGRTFIEIPVIPVARKAGKSKAFKLINLLSVSHTMIKLFLRRLSMFYYQSKSNVQMPTHYN